MKVALLGYSQAGKRTLFTLLTGRQIPVQIKEGEVLEGKAPVRDLRVDAIAKIAKPEKTRYAETTYVLCPDVQVGGAPDAGRAWMEAARQCELLAFVVRAFPDESIYHPRESVDPERDRRDLAAELILADMEVVEKRRERMSKEKRAGQTPQQVAEERALEKCGSILESERRLADGGLTEQELEALRAMNLLTLKPVLWTYNVDEGGVTEGTLNPVTIACRIELDIMGLDTADERREYLEQIGIHSSGVDRMNQAAYDALGLMSFYTMGEDEVRAWTIHKGATAPVAAGKIHSDIERGFIRAEVIKYDDLIALGSEQAVKTGGKALLKGRDYVIEDGDICFFRFNV